MKTLTVSVFLSAILIVIYLAACSAFKPTLEATTDAEIGALISQMTIEEKVGQMTQLNLDVVCVGEIYKLEEPHRLDPAKLRKALVEHHVGSILNCGGHAYPRAQWLELIGGIQKLATEETRLKIPILYGVDAIHGANYVMGSTLFPQQLGQAATFNTAYTKRAAQITAYETRSIGIPWNFSPVLDAGRHPLWSRFFETYGEDALVCSRFGAAAIIGYQGEKSSAQIGPENVAACMKHFLGYSGSRTGKDRTPAYISEIQMREQYIPSFKKAIEEGALTVMINSGEINGIPVHADKKILTDLLRGELKFEGVVVTDWEDVIKLYANHRVASSLKDAVQQAVDAGIDLCMVPNDYDFTKYLIELVKEGKISEARLNISVERILKLKKKLGILSKISIPNASGFPLFGSAQYASVAKDIATESITLLENRNNILPLSTTNKIMVTGPAANSMTLLNGAWTRTWQGVDPVFDDASKNTIFDAIKIKGGANISFIQGCDLDSLLNAEEVISKSADCDFIVACMGEKPSTEKPGDIDDLELPKAQQDFVKQLIATGKPVILILVENRPRIVREIADDCAAVLLAYEPGDYGGDALADILFGIANPSGKLPFTYPKYNNSLLWYDHKYTETLDQNFGNNSFQPQWQFGHGLSYSEIIYSDLQLSSKNLIGNDQINVQVNVSNNSNREAKESVLLFIRDYVASVTPAVRKLKDFQKITLAPNSNQVVRFTIEKNQLSFIGRGLLPIVEEGEFDVLLGNLKATFTYQEK